MTSSRAVAAAWSCPFCPLVCDHLAVSLDGAGRAPTLAAGPCSRASLGLSRAVHDPASPPTPCVDGRACSLDEAVAAAAALLAASRQPLMAGLGTDVAGARALYPLACATGAVCDAAGGDALMHTLRALQDRGQFTTTLAEVRNRADLLVFVGGLPGDRMPLLAQRLGLTGPQAALRHLVLLGGTADDASALEAWAAPGVTVDVVAPPGLDVFDLVSLLLAAVGGAPVPGLSPALSALAARLQAATYAVLVGATSRLEAQGALVVEGVNQIIGRLNARSRAAALWLGGYGGASTVNQVFTWLSGLPLRSRAGPKGLEHEPLAYGTTRMLAQGAADLLLWVSSFDADAAPPATTLPLVLLGHPAQAAHAQRPGSVFIPVATPGIGHEGHLFRTDGTELMRLAPLFDDGLPSVAEVARRLTAAVKGLEVAA